MARRVPRGRDPNGRNGHGPVTTRTGLLVTPDGRPAGLVPLPAACSARADRLRDHAAANGMHGDPGRDLTVLAYRLGWDAHAAGEYPRPCLEDAADTAAVLPYLGQTVWHHTAGATILAGQCCGTPASHRDALVELGKLLRGLAGTVTARGFCAVPCPDCHTAAGVECSPYGTCLGRLAHVSG